MLVSWGDEGASVYQIRRDDVWAGSFIDDREALRPGSIDSEWIVRFRTNEGVVDIPCQPEDTPAAIACSITADDRGLALDWDDVPGIDRYQIRQNGDWIASSQTSNFVHAGEFDVAPYDIRYRPRGAVVTLLCTP